MAADFYSAMVATKTVASPTATPSRRRTDRVVTTNRRAFHEYHILETIEAGLALTGTEIKSIREGKAGIGEAYARIENGELWLIGSYVAPYSHGNRSNHDPDRPRKLLVHRRELGHLRSAVEQKGLTLVPDKRATDADRQSRRDIERALRDRG
jgi:SsrA-binding protein